MVKETREERKAREKEEVDRLTQETLDKMKARSEARKESLQETTKNWSFDGFVTIIVWILCLAGLAFCIITINKACITDQNYINEIAKLNDMIAESKDEFDSIKPAEIDTDIIFANLNSCKEIGEQLATLQNKSIKLRYDLRYTDADKTTVADEISANAKAMGELMENKDGQSCWYPAPTTNCEWTFCTTYQFSGESIPVIWMCYDKDTNDLLAYSTSIYNVVSQKFNKIDTHITHIGQNVLDKEDSSVDGSLVNSTPSDAASEETSGTDVVTESDEE